MFQFYLRPYLAEPNPSALFWKESLKEGAGEGSENLSGPAQMALGIKIDLNRAGAEDLAALPGLGLRMAERIVEDRQQKGPFRKVRDLMRVEGIKEKKFDRIQSYVTVEP